MSDTLTAKKKAQTQVDKALAEVVRLEGVAKDLKESNEKAQDRFNKDVAERENVIQRLKDDVVVAEENVKVVKTQIAEEEAKKIEAIEANRALKAQGLDITEQITEKKEELAKISKDLSKKIDEYNKEIAVKEDEYTAVKNDIVKAEEEFTEIQSKRKITISKLDKDIRIKEEALEEKLKQLKFIEEESDKAEKAASNAEIRQNTAEKAAEEAEAKLTNLNSKITTAEKAAEEATAKLATLQDEVKKLTIERLNSKSFIEELNNKEANLKKKYEDVGLEYKQ